MLRTVILVFSFVAFAAAATTTPPSPEEIENGFEFVTVDPRKAGRKATFYNAKGFMNASTDDPDVINAAEHAAEGVSRGDIGGEYWFKLLAILHAEKKRQKKPYFKDQYEDVYRLIIIVQKTDCKKKNVNYKDIDGCDFVEGNYAYRQCNVIEYPAENPGSFGNSYRDCNYSNKDRVNYIIKAVQGTDEIRYASIEEKTTRPPR